MTLLERLELQPTGPDRFVGAAGSNPDHLFGGQLLAQGLLAGGRTIDPELRAQSLHAVFLVAGAGDRPVDYEIVRLRDGTSFATRSIVGRQDGRAIVTLTASYHRPEGRPLHQVPSPAGTTGPDELPRGRYHSAEVECRDCPADGLDLAHWFRARHPLPEDPALREAALAWVSDNGPTRAARQPHLDHPGFARVQTTSLDHHLWFHRPTSIDRWHVTTVRSTATADARGLVHGTIHDADGRHVASVAQEVLVRLPDEVEQP